MFLLILESLGSTELIFILIMALVFFGPRKLPQISRSLGKNLADFRRASEDFKRTWDREVNLEETGETASRANHFALAAENSILGDEGQPLHSPIVSTPGDVVARHTEANQSGSDSNPSEVESVGETKSSPKNDWL